MLVCAARDLIAAAGSVRISELGQAEVLEAIKLGEDLSQGTRYGKRSCFKRLLNYLAEEHGARQLAKYVPRITPPAPRAVTATQDEKERILAACPTWLKCWVLLCSDLALRNATAASICPENYNEETGSITYKTKFGTWQILPVTDEIRALFAKAPRDTPRSLPYVAALHPNRRICKTWIGQKFAYVVRAAGITRKLTAHDLRRTTAMRVYDMTHDLRMVQAVLGHKQLATTLYYLDHRDKTVLVSTLELAKLNPKTEAIQ